MQPALAAFDFTARFDFVGRSPVNLLGCCLALSQN
jgi:hypothetical protein